MQDLVKKELLDAIAPLDRGRKETTEQSEQVQRLFAKLEKLNPDKK
jgi:PAP_fibrillin